MSSKIKQEFHKMEAGAHKGLIGKTGVIPARSRRCKREQPPNKYHWDNCLGKVWGKQ